MVGLPTWAKRKLEETWPASLSEAITKVENFSDVGRSDKSGLKKDNKFLHKKPRHEGEWRRGQGSPTKDKPKQFQGSGFKPKGSFVRKGAPSKGSEPKGDFGAKPKGACFNCNEVGHYSKDCPKSKFGVGSSNVATPLWPSVGVKPNTSKVGDLESSGTPERLELNNMTQNTFYWGVLGVIRKVLKRRYRKWPCIGHLDICRPSYGQKKIRESNWQFDSRPLEVTNQPLRGLRMEIAIRRWKDLDNGYKFGLDLVAIRPGSRAL